MGAYNFMVDAFQEGRIHDLEQEVKQLKKTVEVTCKWINYLNAELEKLKDEQRRTKNQTIQTNVEG
jgi:septal ring factor EnvC (AmiA/AmiB activator)